jgi:hypothetical protein
MGRAVHLLTYADRLAGDLPGLRALMDGPLAVLRRRPRAAVLPPIDGADAGLRSRRPPGGRPAPGDWDDVAALAGTVDVTVDLIVNHVSTRSPEFLSFLLHGERSPHAGCSSRSTACSPTVPTEHLLGPDLPAAARPPADPRHARRRHAARPVDDVHLRAGRPRRA